MKLIKITCDYCKIEIPPKVLYGILKMPLIEEMNFCGLSCFHDWIKEKYIK